MTDRNLSRRALGKAALATATLSAANILHYPANAAEFTLKFGDNQIPTYPVNVRLKEAADRMRERSGGRLDFQMFINGQLGTDTDMLSQVRSGALHFYCVSGAVLSTLVPLAAIPDVGFAFKTYPQVWAAMDGALGARIRADIEKVHLHPFEKSFDIGFRQITSGTHPINTPDDLKGFKIRIPPFQLGVSMFKALGAAPSTLNWSEVYTALQTKLFDGQENPLPTIDTNKIYEVQKYCSITNHIWDGWWIVGNAAVFAKLPKDMQNLMSEEINRAADLARVDNAKLDASLRPTLEGHGMVFADVDQAAFKNRLKGTDFFKEWQTKFGAEAWSILEKYSDGLA